MDGVIGVFFASNKSFRSAAQGWRVINRSKGEAILSINRTSIAIAEAVVQINDSVVIDIRRKDYVRRSARSTTWFV